MYTRIAVSKCKHCYVTIYLPKDSETPMTYIEKTFWYDKWHDRHCDKNQIMIVHEPVRRQKVVTVYRKPEGVSWE